MIICGQEITKDTVGRIQEMVDREPEISRAVLSRRICEWLGWRSANGKWKEMSCRVVLLKMHRRGIIRLPSAAKAPPARPRRVSCSDGFDKTLDHEPIGCSLGEVGSIELVKVRGGGGELSRTWNELMDRHHYLGSGPLCGAQMRYLIKSSRYGWLGGFAFSSAAWSVSVRDQWIGWDKRAREQNLGQVICNSRFLILPWVHVPSLASHMLSLCSGRLKSDWQAVYGIEPVLMETFVERGRFKGTCYRAANWVYVGETRGRGRQDRENRFSVSVKDVYLFPLICQWQKRLCQGPPQPIEDHRWTVGASDWAEEEFGLAQVGDQRRKSRLLIVARDLYNRPQANIPEACQSRAKTKAAYRFFEHQDTHMEKILASHYEATLNRARQEKVVLAVQDTTSLNYSTHHKTMGLGPIGSKAEGIVGLEVHDTLVFNLERTPLGLLDVQCWARDPNDFGKKRRRYELPIEQKESHKWLMSFRATAEAQKRSPGTRWISVGDREADIYELFQLAAREVSGPKLLVRAERDRLLADGHGHVWEELAQKPMSGIQALRVPRRGKRPAREARLEVRFAYVRLKPPKRKATMEEFSVWAILAEEIDVLEGIEPLKWMLLTTVSVDTFEEAVEKLAWYAGRWGIEVYHRTLKSGCKIEQRQLGSADRIKACLAIDMVVAWRIFHLTKLGRETPNVPCTVFFEEAEWKALYAYVKQNSVPPDNPPTLREAIHMTASLGGFLGRKADGEPGTQSLWLGLQRLDDLASMWNFMACNFAPHLLTSPVSSKPDYG